MVKRMFWYLKHGALQNIIHQPPKPPGQVLLRKFPRSIRGSALIIFVFLLLFLYSWRCSTYISIIIIFFLIDQSNGVSVDHVTKLSSLKEGTWEKCHPTREAALEGCKRRTWSISDTRL